MRWLKILENNSINKYECNESLFIYIYNILFKKIACEYTECWLRNVLYKFCIFLDLVLWLLEKFEDIRNLPSCWSENCRSSVWFVKSLRTLKLICVSKVQLLAPCRKHQKHTLLVFLKILTCAPFMPSVLLSCQKISS